MGHGLRDFAGHNAWATAQVLAFCRGPDGPELKATVPGTFGTIVETLRHLIDAEASYLYRLTGAWPAHPWRGDVDAGLDVLAERAAVLATTLEEFLASDWDDERLGEARGDQARSSPSRPGSSSPRRCTMRTSTARTSVRSSARWGTRRPTSRLGATPSPAVDRD